MQLPTAPRAARTGAAMPRGGGTGGRGPLSPSHARERASAEAKAAGDALKAMLKIQAPWTREVEAQRKKCREAYLQVLFPSPMTSQAQSLDGLWIQTSYSLISAFRDAVVAAERALPAPVKGRKPGPAQQELSKVLTRFRQALVSEEGFYRNLIGRLVEAYQLQDLAQNHLSYVGIMVQDESPVEGAGLSIEERKDKLGLVYKALVCLGDLERYKEVYSERSRRQTQDKNAVSARGEEKYGKAKAYYEAARGMIPSDGSAFNQLAVIGTYESDDFACAYYYFRAMAVKSPFKDIDKIMDKFFTRAFEKWWSARKIDSDEEDEASSVEPPVDVFKKDFLAVCAILFRKTGLSQMSSVRPKTLRQLEVLLRDRQLPSETIAKITATSIALQWHARSTASLSNTVLDEAGQGSKGKRGPEFEVAALLTALSVFETLFKVATAEIQEVLASAAYAEKKVLAESAIIIDQDDELALHQHISAVLRRVLPSLRIISKWMKIHLEYVSRIAPASGDLLPAGLSFWRSYVLLVASLSQVFPIEQLPSLSGALEEDVDMQGFLPLSLGATTTATLGMQVNDDQHHDVHPNEEQLMRISDLQVDARLMSQTSAGQAMDALHTFGNQGSLVGEGCAMVAGYFPTREVEHDLASVSTETEDDPVNLAMRATLVASSVDSEEPRYLDQPPQTWSYHPHTSIDAAPVPRATNTALDLLNNLMISSAPQADNKTAAGAPGLHPGGQPNSERPPSGSGSPGLLFGGDMAGSGTIGGSIWSMTRDESEKGKKRAGQQAISAIWDAPAPVANGSLANLPPTYGLAPGMPTVNTFGQPRGMWSSPGPSVPPPANQAQHPADAGWPNFGGQQDYLALYSQYGQRRAG